MKTELLLGAALMAAASEAVPTVDTTYPYTGPDVPVGDWVNPTANGNGKGFPRLVEAPAVKPATANPTNNVNVIALAYVPQGMNIHYQTPFGLGVAPSVKWGTSPSTLTNTATGASHSYDRTPPCSMITAVTQCSQYFHEVQLTGLKADTTYYYQIPAANGTTQSDVLNFTTARAAGDSKPFSVAVLNDMGYTNAQGTYAALNQAVNDGTAFAWHGGDISYADDWYSGILPCEDSWPVCYNGTSTEVPTGDYPDGYNKPLPAGEIPNQGSWNGGDMSVLYESNWDFWQQWIQTMTSKIPYMVLPGNHEAACAEFDGPNNELTAYLNGNKPNSTASKSSLTYFSCPPSQRNYTAYQHRFRMPGQETGGVGNMWYSFDYGLAHFVSINGETDYAMSPESPFIKDTKGVAREPLANQTYVTDSGPFGRIDNNDYNNTKAYQQYQWLAKDLASVDRTKTPWVFVMSHRPMYSSGVSAYQKNIRDAFEALLLQNGVDGYFAGHIHWYERLFPMGRNGTIDTGSVINNKTYYTNPGVSMTHIVNGMAGNIESHSTLDPKKGLLPLTAVLDQTHYGFSKLIVHNASVVTWQFILGNGSGVGDELTLIKKETSGGNGTSTAPPSSGSSTPSGPYGNGTVTTTTKVVTAYTTYCPGPTTIVQGSQTYTATKATTLTITNCPCTLTQTLTYPATSSQTSGAKQSSTLGSGAGGAGSSAKPSSGAAAKPTSSTGSNGGSGSGSGAASPSTGAGTSGKPTTVNSGSSPKASLVLMMISALIFLV